MANMRHIMPALQRATTARPTGDGLCFRSATPPQQMRQTRIVKNLPPEEVAREIVAWITEG
jgi:electron transfer flavoprotein beta subunit